ncbi:protein translocase subunit SecF [Allosphingosinicella vermicomposti]|uniref:protein translocase subunit SecF n=1 Tax=Allosphingosinicella vermicomposti TaxID=614671 RepID=UPI000D0E45BF|nr:protein translocase subunit SecF [Allosphingosinicella vermicomposti]
MRLLKLVPDNTNIDFMRWRTVGLVLSLLITIASIGLVATRGLNLGVDFVGGQMLRVSFSEPVEIDTLRDRIEALNHGDATIQEFGGPQTISIRLPLPEGGEAAANAAAEQVKDVVSKEYPSARFDAVETVSGKVSGELFRSGALAIGLAMLGIAIYIWFRFEWQFGVGALTTLFHDVVVTLGFFALTQLEFNLNVVAAILTIVGYSLNDTVVIYDRIRENLRKYRKMETVPMLNVSLNETLSRTVVTSLSIMLALAMLLIFGPDVIFGLTIAIFIGIFVGTYSSIYISSPILVALKVGPDSFIAKAAPVGEQAGSRNEGY